jgi:uncharacterized protein YhaN
MKLLRLELLKFGAFTDVVLDFSALEHGVHVIYGNNEAGKSTTLRAISGVLFGIPERTSDDHQHKMSELRIGAWLCSDAGKEIRMVRRKGRVNTLLNHQGQSMDERGLLTLLGGVQREMFETMFGLNHDNLRLGGQALLDGSGEVGQSLFGAGMGHAGIHKLLETLEKKADELFKPHAKKPPLNATLVEYAEAKKRIHERSLQAKTWVELEKALQSKQHIRDQLQAQLKGHQFRLAKLERIQRIRPYLVERQELQYRQDAMGPVTILPEHARQQREDAQRSLRESGIRSERLQHSLTERAHALSQLAISPALLEERAAIQQIQRQLGGYLKNSQRLPEMHRELQQVNHQIQQILTRLGRPVSLDNLEAIRLSDADQARIRQLGHDRPNLDAKLHHLDERRTELSMKIKRQEEELAKLPPIKDASDVVRIVDEIRGEGNIETRWLETQREQERLASEIQRKLSVLGLWQGTIEALISLEIPASSTIERFINEAGEFNRDLQLYDRQLIEKKEEIAQVEGKLEELRLAGEVPTERELIQRRQERQEHWQRLRQELDSPGTVPNRNSTHPSLFRAYEQAVLETDELGDRLRREADRVATYANYSALLSQRREEAQALDNQIARRRHARSNSIKRWKALWEPLSIVPLSPVEMREWLSRHAELVRDAEILGKIKQRVQTFRERMDVHRQTLDDAFVRLGVEANISTDSFSLMVRRAADWCEKASLLSSQCSSLTKTLQVLMEDRFHLDKQLQSAKAQSDKWQIAWTKAVEVLRLPSHATPQEAEAVMLATSELFSKEERAHLWTDQLTSLQRECDAFSHTVQRVFRRCFPERSDKSVEIQATILVDELQVAEAALARRHEIEEQCKVQQSELEDWLDKQKLAEKHLEDLMRIAGVSHLEELYQAETRSEQASAIRHELQLVDTTIRNLSGGMAVEELAQEAKQEQADGLGTEIEQIKQAIHQLQTQVDAVHRELGGLQTTLQSMSGQSQAADAAETAQRLLARMREQVEEYSKIRLSALLLRREMERYRQANQGPLLQRTSHLYQMLTLDSFREVTVGYSHNDQAVLQCVRPDGTTVSVAGLSEGTRDQLYLALRLASIEKHMLCNEAIPFIADDIFIQFDDQRSRAALRILDEVSDKTQVLLFTHHRRLVELAQEAIPATRLQIHDLDALRAQSWSQSSADNASCYPI